jgi:hypothetical protein
MPVPDSQGVLPSADLLRQLDDDSLRAADVVVHPSGRHDG